MWTRLFLARVGGVVFAGLLLWTTVPGVLSAEPLLIRSRSSQFVVRGKSLGAPLIASTSTSQVSYVRLDPALLAVSLERIKAAVLDELGASDQWQGAINVLLHPLQRDEEPITVISTRYLDRWSYRIELPELVNRDHLFKAAVQVLLMEIANRCAGESPAELPPWLAEGLVAHLQATSLSMLMLEPQTSIVAAQRNRDPLRRAREQLRARLPLTLNELNLPAEEQLSGEGAEVYRSCAQLFVHELLRLKNGRACLRDMLAIMPERLNWQTAFLRAFHEHFRRLVDVDKWWALTVVSFTGRDLFSTWPRAESWKKLDEILITPVEVRLERNDLPVVTDAKLQNLMTEWDFARQVPLLRQKLNHLQALRLRVVPELTSLVDGYYHVLDSYLQKRSRRGTTSAFPHQPPPNIRVVVKETLKRLDELDEQREFLRKKPNAAQLSQKP